MADILKKDGDPPMRRKKDAERRGPGRCGGPFSRMWRASRNAYYRFRRRRDRSPTNSRDGYRRGIKPAAH